MDALEVVKFYLDLGYAAFTSFNFPGTNFTPLAALLMSAFVVVFIRFIKDLTKSNRTHGGVSRPPKVDN